MLSLQLIGVVAVVTTACICLQSFIRARHSKNFARARHLPQIDKIFGLDFFLLERRARKSGKYLDNNVFLYNRHGNTVASRAMMRDFIMTNDPENIQTVLASKFTDYQLGPRLRAFGPLLGQGIFTADGETWKHSRALIRPSFTRLQTASLDRFEDLIAQMLQHIPRDGRSIDLQPLFFRLSFDGITGLIFGKSAGTLDFQQSSASQDFAEAFDYAQTELSIRSRLFGLIWLYWNPKFNLACKKVHQYVDNLVEKALNERHSTKADPGKAEKDATGGPATPYVLLDVLVDQINDPKRIRFELLNVLLAGRDTTAGLLSNIFFVLARRNDVWEKLQQEVRSLNGVKPDYDTLLNMKYLQNTVHEALRLYPPVPVNSREAVNDTVLPVGGGPDRKSPIFVPAGTTVAYSAYALHRRQDIYGPDAKEFKPERWETMRPGNAYVPFNKGPRICIGKQDALTKVCYTVVRMLQTFDSIKPSDDAGWKEHLHLTLSVENGVNVTMTAA